MLRLPEYTFSYSNLDLFNTCPKLYHAEKIAKSVPFQESEAMSSGKRMHKMLENYINEGAAVSPGMLHVTKTVDKLVAGADMVMSERKIAVTSDLAPTDFFNKNVAYRGIIDITALHKKIAIIGDLKTGSEPRETFMQLKLNSTAVFAENPDIHQCSLWYIYTKFPPRRLDIKRSELPALLEEVVPQVERMKTAAATGEFPARQCWKCKQFCPLKTCPYNKSRK